MSNLPATRNGLPNAASSRSGKMPDPRKWHFDATSGEYFRITGHHKGHVVYDTTPYSSRVLKDYESSKGRSADKRILIVLVAIILFFVIVFYRDQTVGPVSLPLLIAGFIFVPGCSLMLLATAVGLMSSYLKSDIGPPPVVQRGLEDVEEQKAYGNAGTADLASIHSALSGNPPAAGPRRPLFDE